MSLRSLLPPFVNIFSVIVWRIKVKKYLFTVFKYFANTWGLKKAINQSFNFSNRIEKKIKYQLNTQILANTYFRKVSKYWNPQNAMHRISHCVTKPQIWHTLGLQITGCWFVHSSFKHYALVNQKPNPFGCNFSAKNKLTIRYITVGE